MGDLLLARLAYLGFDVDSREVAPGRPNVWGRLRGLRDGPTLMLAGHLDTWGRPSNYSPEYNEGPRWVDPSSSGIPLRPEPKQPVSRCGWRSPTVTALGITVPRNENIAYL